MTQMSVARPCGAESVLTICIGTDTEKDSQGERTIVFALPGDSVLAHHTVCSSPGLAIESVRQALSLDRDIIDLYSAEILESPDLSGNRGLIARSLISGLKTCIDDLGNSPIDTLQGISHMIENRKTLATAPRISACNTVSVPAVSVGAGPSLDKNLDALKALSGKVFVVASDAAVDKLLDHGITVHCVTPLERLACIQDLLKRPSYHCIYAGLPVVWPSIVKKFYKHIVVGGADEHYSWFGTGHEDIVPIGRSTGTLSLGVAATIAEGQPIYLVGHDLCIKDDRSHFSDMPDWATSGTWELETAGYSGPVKTRHIWMRLKHHIESVIAMNNLTVINCSDGAVIDGATEGVLPSPDSLTKTISGYDLPSLVESDFGRRVDETIEIMRKGIDLLRSVEVVDLRPLFGKCAGLVSHILRQVTCMVSLDRRAGYNYNHQTKFRDYCVVVLSHALKMMEAARVR